MVRYDLQEANQIKQARLKKGYSQMQVATIIGVSCRVYQRYEYGECALYRARLRFALTLCEVLDIDPYSFAHMDSPEEMRLYAKEYNL